MPRIRLTHSTRRLAAASSAVALAVTMSTVAAACAQTVRSTSATRAAGATAATSAKRGAAATAARAGTAAAPAVQVVASGLDQPKKLTVAPNGSLIVALSGDGAAPVSCTNGDQASCLDSSGAIDEVSTGGRVQTLVSGLPSISSGSSAGVATGPAQARMIDGKLQVLFQDAENINAKTGREPFGAAGDLLGDLARFSATGGSRRIEASFGPFEAAHNPDRGAGTGVARGLESAIDSDPYAFVPYRGGYAVADAGGNDLLFVSRTGKISVLAVLPTITEKAAPGAYEPSQTRTITAHAEAVPDSVAVGPDGALYVGELGGVPSDTGTSSVYRVVPGHAPTVYARGFTAISDIAFDRAGRLLVLEIDQKGLNDPALKGPGLPTPGAVIRVGAHGARSVLASTGLEFPTGMAVAHDGTVYVSDFGIASAGGGSGGTGGEIVRVASR